MQNRTAQTKRNVIRDFTTATTTSGCDAFEKKKARKITTVMQCVIIFMIKIKRT